MRSSPYRSLTEEHAVIEITNLRPIVWRAIQIEWPNAKRPVVILTENGANTIFIDIPRRWT